MVIESTYFLRILAHFAMYSGGVASLFSPVRIIICLIPMSRIAAPSISTSASLSMLRLIGLFRLKPQYTQPLLQTFARYNGVKSEIVLPKNLSVICFDSAAIASNTFGL